jgi:hypothetical protein
MQLEHRSKAHLVGLIEKAEVTRTRLKSELHDATVRVTGRDTVINNLKDEAKSAELQLQRALGYIDAMNEDKIALDASHEPPQYQGHVLTRRGPLIEEASRVENPNGHRGY